MSDLETRNGGQRVELGTQDEVFEWIEDLAHAAKELLLWFGVGIAALGLAWAVIEFITRNALP